MAARFLWAENTPRWCDAQIQCGDGNPQRIPAEPENLLNIWQPARQPRHQEHPRLDSIITAVGMVDDVRIMIAAVVVSVALMMVFAGPIGRFVSDHPTIKILALSFLVVVGVVVLVGYSGRS